MQALLLLLLLLQAAVAEFRAKVLGPLFADLASQTKFWGKPIKFDAATYIARTEKLAAAQLGYTLQNLAPVDAVGLFKVTFKTSTDAPAKNGGSGIVDEAGKAQAQTKAAPKP
jgi:hypothetical protein